MPTIHYEQHDFRKGRLGEGVSGRRDTKAYYSSVRDSNNAMVLQDGQIWRRWGTFIRAELGEDARLASWEFADGPATEFLLVFSAGRLRIFDMTLTLRADFTGCPWTAEGVRFLQVDFSRARMVVTDQSFRTQIVDYDAAAGTFTRTPFAFELTEDQQRLRAPFHAFASKTNKATLTIFTSAGQSTGYGPHIALAGGFSPSTFDLATGTGEMTMSEPLFTAAHVGTRMRLIEGEIEILSVVSPTKANIKVWRDVAVKLEANPFYVRKNSKLVEVYWFNHKLRVGDQVYFVGLSNVTDDAAAKLLSRSCKTATDGSTVAAPAATAAPYTVRRVIDADRFEIEGDGVVTSFNIGFISGAFGGSTQTSSTPTGGATAEGFYGGADVIAYPLSGVYGVAEPVYSELRGWPQACCFHETRLWLGGSAALPDAMFGSEIASSTAFDTGLGDPTDAVQIYGVGQQARVRHLVSAFDLIVLTDKAEIYIPGNTNGAIIQETARGVTSTNYGAAFTAARRFDGGTIFVDAVGNHIREMSAASKDEEYTAPPLTAAVPEWVRGPDEAALFAGGRHEATPYLIFTNSDDGSALVMHSSRNDDAFGFMLWTLKNGSFRSFAGVGRRLFAVAQRGEEFFLLEFDSLSANPITVDFATSFTAEEPTTGFVSPYDAGRVVQMQSGSLVYSEALVGEDGSFSTPEPVTQLAIGDEMPFLIQLHSPVVAAGEGPKSSKMQRLVSVQIDWNGTETGEIDGEAVLEPGDNPLFGAPEKVKGWREYFIGKWDRGPTCTITASRPGQVRVRGATQDAYF